jgi:hypothetical protein
MEIVMQRFYRSALMLFHRTVADHGAARAAAGIRIIVAGFG